MIFWQLFGTLLAAFGLSYAIMHALAHTTRGAYRFFRLLLLPGVVTHELSHALACFITATPIESISFWDETGGHVSHHKPRYSLLVQPIISLAPFVVGLALLFGMSHIVLTSVWWLTIILVMLMLSIAATLAPSKTDLIHAGEGIAFLVIIGGTTFYYFPTLAQTLSYYAQTLIHPLFLIDAILGAAWIGLTVLHTSLRK